MTETDKKKAAKAFAEYWKDRGDEKSDSQSQKMSYIIISPGVNLPLSRKRRLRKQRRLFLTHARSIPIVLWRTFTMKLLCRSNSARHTKQMTKQLCKPTAFGANSIPSQRVWQNL